MKSTKTVRNVTIRDVAKQAGVGVGTVSRVLNDHASVSPDMRAHILSVMSELRFRPDSIAQDLNRKYTKCLGVVVPDLINPFFAELVQALGQAARQENYNLFLANSSEDPTLEAESIDSLCRRRIDGLFLIAAQAGLGNYQNFNVPIIHVDHLPDGSRGVSADHAGGVGLAVRYLNGLGHRKIALLAGARTSLPATLRRDSYIRAMAPTLAELGLPIDDYIVTGHFDLGSGEVGLRQLMSLPDGKRPTAIIASSDLQAIGALHAAHGLGLAVPRDVSLIGFDGLTISGMITPRITTIEQPVDDIAKTAFSLFREVRDQASERRQVLLDCRLRPGETCTAPPDE